MTKAILLFDNVMNHTYNIELEPYLHVHLNIELLNINFTSQLPSAQYAVKRWSFTDVKETWGNHKPSNVHHFRGVLENCPHNVIVYNYLGCFNFIRQLKEVSHVTKKLHPVSCKEKREILGIRQQGGKNA